MHLAIGNDHAGTQLKAEIVGLLISLGHTFDDFGAADAAPVDYPDPAAAVAKAVAAKSAELGILICGTGIGVCISANKVNGVRAALCHDTFSARASREHNHANVLCLGARVIGPGLALDIVRTWLATPPSHDERHLRRVEKISRLEC